MLETMGRLAVASALLQNSRHHEVWGATSTSCRFCCRSPRLRLLRAAGRRFNGTRHPPLAAASFGRSVTPGTDYTRHVATIGGGQAISFARRQRFCAIAARLLERSGAGERSGDIAGILIDAARDFALGRLGTASGPERTRAAVRGLCAIEQCHAIVDVARRVKRLALRADIDIPFLVESED